jgi:hypothetical protein
MSTLPKLRACSILVFLCAQLLPAQKTPGRVEPPEIQQHIDKVTACLRPKVNDLPHPCATLSERMSALHIPGVSIAVFHNGVTWARGRREASRRDAGDARHSLPGRIHQ